MRVIGVEHQQRARVLAAGQLDREGDGARAARHVRQGEEADRPRQHHADHAGRAVVRDRSVAVCDVRAQGRQQRRRWERHVNSSGVRLERDLQQPCRVANAGADIPGGGAAAPVPAAGDIRADPDRAG